VSATGGEAVSATCTTAAECLLLGRFVLCTRGCANGGIRAGASIAATCAAWFARWLRLSLCALDTDRAGGALPASPSTEALRNAARTARLMASTATAMTRRKRADPSREMAACGENVEARSQLRRRGIGGRARWGSGAGTKGLEPRPPRWVGSLGRADAAGTGAWSAFWTLAASSPQKSEAAHDAASGWVAPERALVGPLSAEADSCPLAGAPIGTRSSKVSSHWRGRR
jgi:hypothetical protein